MKLLLKESEGLARSSVVGLAGTSNESSAVPVSEQHTVIVGILPSVIKGKWIPCQSPSLTGHGIKTCGFTRADPMNTRRASSWKELALALSRLPEGPRQHRGWTMDPIMAWVLLRNSGGCPAHSGQYATLRPDESVLFALLQFPIILTCIIQTSGGETSNQYHYVPQITNVASFW